MREIFAVQNLNMTEFARSFALYKLVVAQKPKFLGKRGKDDEKEAENTEANELFTKRL